MVECGCGHDAGVDKGICKNCGLPKHVMTELHPAEPLKKKAIKNGRGKTRFDLVPIPAMRAIAESMAAGLKDSRTPYDWLHGTDWSEYIAAMDRHWNDFKERKDIDKEDGVRHIRKAITNLAILVTYDELRIGNDDRPPYDKLRGQSE